jgi:hypothetical protein
MRLTIVPRSRSIPISSPLARGCASAARLLAGIVCLTIGSVPTAGVAHAHVKWFVTCNPSDSPLPLRAVLADQLWLFAALFMALFYLACRVEQTIAGSILMELLDRATGFLRDRKDALLRATASVRTVPPRTAHGTRT